MPFPPLVRAALAGAALMLLAACGKRETPVEAGIRTRTLLVGNFAEPATLDPHAMVALTDFRVVQSLFEGLTALDESTAQPLPAVAERWETSADGLTYTFHLRSSAKWSNGDRVTAGDFVYAFRRILTPAFGAPYSYMLWPIKHAEAFNKGTLTDFAAVGVSAPDEATLRVVLERPTSYLPALAAHSSWFPVPRATIEKFGRLEARDSVWTLPGNIVSNGPFTLQEWRPNARIVVARNPLYWGAADNALERVMFFPIENADTEERNFRAGQLHVTHGVSSSKIPSYRQRTPDQLRIGPLLATSYLNFNVTKPPLNNPKVRKALALTLDRRAISERIFDGAFPPATAFVPPGCGGYRPPAGLPEDFGAARAALAEAGFPEGRGLPPLPLQVDNNQRSLRTAEIIQALWLKELGVRVTIETLEQKTHFQNQQNLAHTIAWSGWSADYPDAYNFLEIFRTGNGNNWSGWANPAYDALLDEANRNVDPARRFELLQRAEALMLEDVAMVPLFNQASLFLLHPAVKNWQLSPLSYNRYHAIRLAR